MSGKPTAQVYEDKFMGMDRRLDPDKLMDGYSPMAVNVDLDRLGTVRKRKGTSLLGASGTKNTIVQSLTQFINQNGKNELHLIRGGSVYKLDTTLTVPDWTLLKADQFPSLNQVQSVNFKNRIYHVSLAEGLRWNSGDSTFTQVSGGTKQVPTGQDADGNTIYVSTTINPIKANCAAVGQRTLFLGNVIVDDVAYPDRVYYSRFDTANNVEDDQLWNDEETGLTSSTRWFRVEGGNVQAIVSYPTQNKVLIFSDTKCYYFDVNQVETNPFNALVELFPMGCAGPRAAIVVDGLIYWMDKQAKIWCWTGASSRPDELSYQIDDGNLGDSIISQIDKSSTNITKVCAFGTSKKIYFSVGTISLDREVLPNACIKLTNSQNGLRALFSIDTFPDRILESENANINGGQFQVVGNSNNVLLMNQTYNDINSDAQEIAVNMYYRTKSYHFGFPFQTKTFKSLEIKYRPQSTEKCFLEVGISVESSPEYTTITDPDRGISNFGQIDMYDPNYEQLRQATARVNILPDIQGRTVSLQFANRQKNEGLEISAFSFDLYDVQNALTQIK